MGTQLYPLTFVMSVAAFVSQGQSGVAVTDIYGPKSLKY